MNRHQAIVKAFEDDTIGCLERCLPSPTEVEVNGDVIGVFNGIEAHDDCHLGENVVWSAFYVLHNDGCRVWGRNLALIPQEGETFAMNIHKRHGVQARRKTNQVFLAVHADGKTEREARAKLRQILKEAL